jgi:uncharacterized protein (TIGR03086 family)
MSQIGDRYRTVAGAFTQRVVAVPANAWDAPAPCDGWVARDVVGHLVTWVPAFLEAGGGPMLPDGPTVDEDPARAWTVMSDAIQGLLDAPSSATVEVAHPQAGTHTFEHAISMFVLGDILVHTWDLARATGLDETLDEDEVRGMFAGMEPLDEMLRSSGHYGPRVSVPDDADAHTKLIAFTGRQP